MPVDVHIPIDIRMGSRITSGDLARLELEAGDIVRRALEVARDAVLVPRGHARSVIVHRDGIRFAPVVERSEVQAAITEAVERALDHAIAASEVESWYSPGRVSALSGKRAGEPLDEQRMSRNGYGVSSYDDHGSPVEVATSEEPSLGDPWTLEIALRYAWDAHLARHGAVWDPDKYGYPGYYGNFSLEGTGVLNHLVYIVDVEGLDEDSRPTALRWQGAALTVLAPSDDDDPEAPLHRRGLPPVADHYVLSSTDLLATAANLLKLMEESARVHEDYPYDEPTRRRIATELAKPGWSIFRLDGAPIESHLVLPPALESALGHVPVHFIAPEQTDSGTGGGSGRREGEEGHGPDEGDFAPGAGSETAIGEGMVWPQRSGDGDTLVCEPFLGEPSVTQLLVGGAELNRTMQSLAEALEVPYCGYAGHVALNLADVIGGHAHAVGVASGESTAETHVTLMPEGGGNNGYVDIKAANSAELNYMQVLAGLAVRVSDFADAVKRTYEMPANAHLVYPDKLSQSDPSPAMWNREFSSQFGRKLERSCMWLYAECCRVILLQQLRTSHQGITERRKRFDVETLPQFEQTLAILGQSVMELITLKRAVEYAGSWGQTGSIRSVLSVLPPKVRSGRSEEYNVQPPAPIEFVPADILTELEQATIVEEDGAHVAYFEGRRLTVEELEQGIALRRSFLNTVDPLFFQIPDLENLYSRFRRTPDGARTYLDALLKEMLAANTTMMAKTREASNGAFFSLEASQYVRARGGRNARGLKFDLQGIHALADDVLRPHIEGLGAYRRGINLALAIKAGWDDLVVAFSTFGIILLGLFCTPLGAGVVFLVTSAAGLALTAWDLAEAARMESLYRSLLDPEAILAWQDVELQRLMAMLSVAFSVFDVAGVVKGSDAIVREFIDGVRRVSTRVLREATASGLELGGGRVLADTTKDALEAEVLRLTVNLTSSVLENAIKQAISATSVVLVLNQLLPVVLTPVLVPWMRSVAVANGTLPEVDAALGALIVGEPPQPPPTEVDLFPLLAGEAGDPGQSGEVSTRVDSEEGGI